MKLEQFITEMLNADALSEKIKKDTLKIMSCLIFIRDNINNVSNMAPILKSNDKDLIKQHYTEFYQNVSRLSLKTWDVQRDIKKGVLRDQNGISFHINYSSAEEAHYDLLNNQIGYIETVLDQLTPLQRVEFAKKLEFDRATGCIGGRTKAALAWAGNIILFPAQPIDSIMGDCLNLWQADKISKQSFSEFVFNYCLKNNIIQCCDKNGVQDITQDFLKQYAIQMGVEDAEEEKEIKDDISSTPAIVIHNPLKILPDVIKLRDDKIIYYFSNENDVKYFSTATQFPFIQSGPKNFVMNLLPHQFNQLIGDDSAFEKIKKIFNDALDITENNISLFSENIKSFLNQNHLLQHMALVQMDNNGNMLRLLAIKNNEQDLLNVIDKLDSETCQKAALLTDKDGWCSFKTLAKNASEKVLMAFIDKLDSATCQKAALLTDKDGWCFFYVLAKNDSEKVLIAFLNKLDCQTIRQSFSKKTNQYFLISWLANKNNNILELFFSKLTPLDYHSIKMNFSQTGHNQDLLSTLIKKNSKNIVTFFRYLHPDSKKDLIKYLSNPKNIKMSYRCLPIFLKKISNEVIEDQLLSDFILSLEKIVKTQLNSCIQYFEPIDEAKDENFVEQENILIKLIKLFNQGNALVKMIRNDREANWPEFLLQLKDYNFRASLRKELKKSGFKWVHLNNEIIALRSEKEEEKHKLNKQYSYSKKSASTLIPINLSIFLFGGFDEKREMVGLLFDATEVKMKALLNKDCGTFNRQWVNQDKQEVINFQEKMKNISFVDFDLFREHIQNNDCTNEVLACYNRESMRAIIITHLTLKATEIARQRRKDIQEKLGMTLPIIYLDVLQQKLFYFKEELYLKDMFLKEINSIKNTITNRGRISDRKKLLFKLADLLENRPQDSIKNILKEWLLENNQDDLIKILSQSNGIGTFFRINIIDYTPLIYNLAGGKEEFNLLQAASLQQDKFLKVS